MAVLDALSGDDDIELNVGNWLEDPRLEDAEQDDCELEDGHDAEGDEADREVCHA
jgi:hypothetical protein